MLAGIALVACTTSSSPHARVAVHLTLSSTTLAAGESTAGVITVVNPGGTFVVRSCQTDGTLVVGLSSEKIPFVPYSGAIVCKTSFRHGTTTIRVMVRASYAGCGVSGLPPCGSPPNRIPALPAGSYSTAVGWASMPSFVVKPPALRVTVLPRAVAPVLRVWTAFFDGSTPAKQKVALVQNGEIFRPVIDAQSRSGLARSVTVDVTNVKILPSGTASVTYTILVAGTPMLTAVQGSAIRQGDAWKVSVQSFCGLLAMEQTSSPGCRTPS